MNIRSLAKKPDWILLMKKNPEKFLKLTFRLTREPELSKLILKCNQKYLAWDKFQHLPMPEGIEPIDAWCCLMIKRSTDKQALPLKSNKSRFFGLGLTPEHHRQLSQIDTLASGAIATDEPLPEERKKNQLLLNGLMEEAITSSQLEGASTLKDVAKKMLLTRQEPKDQSQRMILNNYLAMTKVKEWKNKELSENLIKDIHHIITQNLLPDSESRKYRRDKDDITVSNPLTGEVYHHPKKVSRMKKEMQDLCDFANTDDEDHYIHPVIKAITLHFWIGYLHPFTDGNGRTARLLFYWYLIKKGYWLLEYIPTSDVIKKSKNSYQKAYIYTNQEDELDLGYFVQYMLRSIILSIENFEKYLKKNRRGGRQIRKSLEILGHFNDRQVSIINTLKKHGNPIDIETHRRKFQLSYEMSRKDFLRLEERGVLKKRKSGKKFLYTLTSKIRKSL